MECEPLLSCTAGAAATAGVIKEEELRAAAGIRRSWTGCWRLPGLPKRHAHTSDSSRNACRHSSKVGNMLVEYVSL